jgi:hypothetical protein
MTLNIIARIIMTEQNDIQHIGIWNNDTQHYDTQT